MSTHVITPPTRATAVYTSGWWARCFAAIADNIIQLCAIFVLYLTGSALDNEASWAMSGVGIVAILVLYAPLMLAYNGGQTFGKMALGVKVVRNRDSAPVGFWQAFGREAALKALVGAFLWPLYLIDCLWAAFREDRRSLHDLACGTCVIDSK